MAINLDRFLEAYKEKVTIVENQNVMDMNNCIDNCELCSGTGYIYLRFDGEDTDRCAICPNQRIMVIKNSPGLYGIESNEYDWSWELVKSIGTIERAVEAVRETINKGHGWVYLHSSSKDNRSGYGTGKTLILKIAIAECLRSGKNAAYQNMAAILDDMRSAFDDPNSTAAQRLEFWSNLDILAIDEFEKIVGSDWENNRIFRLMDKRYVDSIRGKSITLMASNKNPMASDGYLWSRISDGRNKVIMMNNDDIRPLMKELEL